jgi:hypothetical protein
MKLLQKKLKSSKKQASTLNNFRIYERTGSPVLSFYFLLTATHILWYHKLINTAKRGKQYARHIPPVPLAACGRRTPR